MSAENVKSFYEKFQKDAGKMQKESPEMVKAFMGLFHSTMSEGALDVKTKELIALTAALAVRCEPCIYMHVQKCVAAGATRKEILETAAVVVMMQGGPAFTYIPKVMDALEALGQ
jgi:AhpD family alkylhydroperoxidase